MPTQLQIDLLKGNLGFFDANVPPAMLSYLSSLLQKAVLDLQRIDIILDPNDVDDASLAAMYAAWLYRKRDTGEGKPRMLMEEIRNRQVTNATKGRIGT